MVELIAFLWALQFGFSPVQHEVTADVSAQVVLFDRAYVSGSAGVDAQTASVFAVPLGFTATIGGGVLIGPIDIGYQLSIEQAIDAASATMSGEPVVDHLIYLRVSNH